LEKMPAKISILDLLKISNAHKNILYKNLQNSGVSTEVDPTNLQAMIACLDTNNHITFDHTAILHNNPEHNLPLYLEVVVTHHKIKRVLVDGGSGLNICTLKLVKQL
ncbi:hypothetical protein KI387_032631, partial [Taxus chinensis]